MFNNKKINGYDTSGNSTDSKHRSTADNVPAQRNTQRDRGSAIPWNQTGNTIQDDLLQEDTILQTDERIYLLQQAGIKRMDVVR